MAYGKIPDSVIEAVLRHHDIVETVGKYVHLSKHGKYMKGLCPFHSEKTPSFTVTPEKQIFYCYGCGKGGNVNQVYRGNRRIFVSRSRSRYLAEEAGIPVTWSGPQDRARARQETVDRDKLIEAHELTAKLYHYLLMNTTHGQPALQYLRSTGRHAISRSISFMIGYAPPEWDTLYGFWRNGSLIPL